MVKRKTVNGKLACVTSKLCFIAASMAVVYKLCVSYFSNRCRPTFASTALKGSSIKKMSASEYTALKQTNVLAATVD